VKAHNLTKTICQLFILISLYSCSKEGTDFIDNTSNFPLNWKSNDSLVVIGYNALDSLRAIRNTSVVPFGTKIDEHYGTFRSSYFASYQTTLSSKSFTFASVDSIVLIIPYYATTPAYGSANQPFSMEVYEMTEGIETDPISKKMTYTYNPSLLGSLTNFTANYKDSTLDGGIKAAPAIRVPLNRSLANKIIAPGVYSSDADFQNVLKGLYVRSSGNNSTNGFVLLSIGSDNTLRIYGKNANGGSITSDFNTGGNNSTTINQFLHDNSSLARLASQNPNNTSGDNLLYSHGLSGYVPTLVLPDLSSFMKMKSVFKAELSLYIIDTGVFLTPNLGLMSLDTLNREFALPDELYKKGFLISIKDTSIGGNPCKEYKYNIAMYVNRMGTNINTTRKLRIYSAPLLISNSLTKFSDFLPSSVVIGGTGNAANSKLKLYYTDL
jgi:hypothetical protein